MKAPGFPHHGGWYLDTHITQDASVLSCTPFINVVRKKSHVPLNQHLPQTAAMLKHQRDNGAESPQGRVQELKGGSKDLKQQL